jgi:hypothetical protein
MVDGGWDWSAAGEIDPRAESYDVSVAIERLLRQIAVELPENRG